MTTEATALPLTDRFASWLAEVDEESERLTNRKTELVAQREAELAKVREQFRVELDQIDEALKTGERMRNALAPKPRVASKAKVKDTWTPNEEIQLRVLRSLADGHETVRDLAEHCEVAHGTIDAALSTLRANNEARLKGRIKSRPGAPNGYAITPQGKDRIGLQVVSPIPFRGEAAEAVA